MNSVTEILLSELRENCNSLWDFIVPKYIPLGTPLAIIVNFMEHAEHTPTFLTWYRTNIARFRIVRHNQQAALHSALFNYIQLVISGDRQKYAANIVKPTQIGIKRNKYTFYVIKLSEPFKNLKTSRVPFLGLVL
jgi:hypothetical protein